MRQASWEEMFRHAEMGELEDKPARWRYVTRYIGWEDMVTMVIVMIALLAYVHNASRSERAHG